MLLDAIALNLPKQEDSKAQQNKKQTSKFLYLFGAKYIFSKNSSFSRINIVSIASPLALPDTLLLSHFLGRTLSLLPDCVGRSGSPGGGSGAVFI